jgi:hypothetical protein
MQPIVETFTGGKVRAHILRDYSFKGTVSPVLGRLTVVLLNIVESGEVPLVI